MTDKEYMQVAINLALQGTGYVNPNPLVGAVIVKNNKIIGSGYHETYGDLHAERKAFLNCFSSPKGATLYVTLEPCCHFGKTPPCTEAIIENKIKKVIIGSLDPNEKVAGKGVEILKNAGIEVIIGVLENRCKQINEIFFHYITHKTPFVMMKYAMTLDGKIATVSGDSQWITGEKARENVHVDRNKYMAIMVGVGTVLKDNPSLSCRLEKGKNPIRIICDSTLRTPLDSNIIKTATTIKTIIATTCTAEHYHKPYKDKGCEIVCVSKKNNKVNLKELIFSLGDMGIDSIMLEGGASINFSALEEGIVHKIQAYIAPKVFGGDDAKTPVGGKGISSIFNHVKLKNSTVQRFAEDILIESEVESCLQE